jgi:drug/metabolite transporter (DMT)-like permease
MLLAAMGFSLMGAAAKTLKQSFNAGQLVFYRNAIGLIFLSGGLLLHKPQNKGGKLLLLIFRGLMGTAALYGLLYCVIHMPLGTAMSYNLTSTLFIAILSWLVLKESPGRLVALAVIIGFTGMLLIYKPNIHLPWYYHLAGLFSGVASAISYLTVGRLTNYYDTRIVVLSFISSGVIVPLLFMLIGKIFSIPSDDVFFVEWKWPQSDEWFAILSLGVTALFGQYFVTKAYGADKAGIVSAISYANIVFSVLLGMLLGDAFPDIFSLSGMLCIILSGVLISLSKRKGDI